MKELKNKDILDFLKQEIAEHSEIPERFRCNLAEKENDADFWEDLSEYLDCFRICDVCHKPMIEGYYICDTHYCSENCAHTDYTDKEIEELCQDSDENYYSVWYEDSIIYNKKYREL